MNVPIIDPLQGDFPEEIEEYMEHGVMKCIAFNRRGTLLAAGCFDGSCVIWDFLTRSISKVLKDMDSVAAVTSVCWSKGGHYILLSAADKSLTLWDVVKGNKIYRTTLLQTPLQARLHPGSCTPFICLACPLSSAPMIVNLKDGSTTMLPVSFSEVGSELSPPLPSRNNKVSIGSALFTPTAACFNKYGDLVYVGNSKGEILIIDHQKNQVRGIVPISGGALIKNIVFSRNGQYLLTNSKDRTIRIYENILPVKNGLKALDETNETLNELNEVEKLKAVGSRCLMLFREFHDSITRVHWKAPCFSGDGEWVIGGSANKGEHKIYIWDKAGHLVKILEGPKEALIDLAWHPISPIVVSVSLVGLVYIWGKTYTENWSAFAPDFKELEENEEYVEREDEYDLVPETEKVKESDVNEDEEVDILTMEKDPAFSDSDMSMDELCSLPSVPRPDIPKQQDKCVESSVKLKEAAGQNGNMHATKSSSSPIEAMNDSSGVEDSGRKNQKRRKPSEKLLDMQAVQKLKPCSDSVKTRKKSEFCDAGDVSNGYH